MRIISRLIIHIDQLNAALIMTGKTKYIAPTFVHVFV